MSRICVLSLLAAAACLALGCGPKTARVEGVVPVSGVVTSGGTPVSGASVTFFPDGAGGRAAAGTTDAQGRFELTTLIAKDGAKPGKYKVLIAKTEVTGIGANMSQEEQTKYLEQKGAPPPTETKNLLPPHYGDATKTPLNATVKQGEKNEFTFDLSGAAGQSPAKQ